MSKEQLAFRYDGKRYQYKGLRENQEKDFFQMFLKFYKGDGPSPGEVEACFKDNFPDSRKGADELWQLCKAEQQRVEEKRARKERERRDAEAEEEEAATPRAKKKKDKKKDSDESEKKKKKKKKDSEDSDDKEKKKKKKKKEEEESEDGEKKKKKKDKKKKEEDSDEASSPREKKKKKKKEASSDEEDKRKKKKKEKEEKEARYKDPEDVPADLRSRLPAGADHGDLAKWIDDVLKQEEDVDFKPTHQRTTSGPVTHHVRTASGPMPSHRHTRSGSGIPAGGTVRKFKLDWEGSDVKKVISLPLQGPGTYDELIKIVEQRCDGQSCLSYVDQEGDRIEIDDDESLDDFFEELDRNLEAGTKFFMHCAMAHAPVTEEEKVFDKSPRAGDRPKMFEAPAAVGGESNDAAEVNDGEGKPHIPPGSDASAENIVPPVAAADGARTQEPLMVCSGHEPQSAYGCVLDPSGTKAASTSKDRTARLWDVDTGKKTHTLAGHAGMVLSCDWSKNGRWIVTSSEDKTVKIWEAEGKGMGKKRHTMKGHQDKVYMASFSMDSKYICSASNDKTVKVWDAAGGKKLQTLKGHTASVFGCCFAPGGKMIASAADDHTVKLWNWQEKKEADRLAATITDHTKCQWSVAFSPDGLNLVSSGMDQMLLMTVVNSGSGAPATKWAVKDAHVQPIHRCAFARGGKQVVSCSRDKCIKVWDAETGAPCGHIVNAHTGYIYCISVCKDRCLSSSHEGKLKLWALPGGESEGAT